MKRKSPAARPRSASSLATRSMWYVPQWPLPRFLTDRNRPTLATPEAFLASKAGRSRSPLTTSRRMKVPPRRPIHVTAATILIRCVGEKARITAAGGFVDFGRVNGNLALSRAIGDFEFKKSADLPPEQQIVTAFPDVTVHEITDDDEFLVIACDGTCVPDLDCERAR